MWRFGRSLVGDGDSPSIFWHFIVEFVLSNSAASVGSNCSLIVLIFFSSDGLVGLNKPYGISARIPDDNSNRNKSPSGIVHEVSYTLSDVLPMLAKELNYESLQIIRTPEK